MMDENEEQHLNEESTEETEGVDEEEVDEEAPDYEEPAAEDVEEPIAASPKSAAPAPASEGTVVSNAARAIADSPYFTEAEKSSLLDRLSTDPLGVILESSERVAERIADRRSIYQSAAEEAYAAQAELSPSVFKAYGPAIRRHLNTSVAPQIRGEAKGVYAAALAAVYEEAERTGDLEGAMRKALAEAPAVRPKPEVTAALPPAQRMPTPTVSSRPRPQGSPRPSGMSPAMAHFNRLGVTVAELNDMNEV
jgi:hypothetical protein